MVTNDVGVGAVKLPTGLFNISTFGTLGGCASVTWLVASVLSGIVNLELKIVGLVVSIVVAYVAAFLSGGMDKRRYIVAFFNVFLIYFIVVGATALTPLVNTRTAEEDSPGIVKNLTTPWFPDDNMVLRNTDLQDENTSLKETVETQKDALNDISMALKDTRSSDTISAFKIKLEDPTLKTLDILTKLEP